MTPAEIKWNDFNLSVDLHRSYLDLSMKLNMFYYAITGAILSFHFTNTEVSISKYSLYLPLLLSTGLSIFFIWAAFLANDLRASIRQNAEELGLNYYPEGIVLVVLCAIFGVMLGLVSIALGWYLFFF